MPLPLPITPLQCTQEHCSLPEGGTCALAAEITDPERDCPHLLRQDTAGEPAPAAPAVQVHKAEIDILIAANDDAAPWSGRHLDRDTAEQLLWRSPAKLVAVVGPYNAGKTSLMASLFLQLANGQCRALPYRFASSRTLHGLHELVNKVGAWDQARSNLTDARSDETLEIVGHTPKEQGPARFLHLGLCPRNRGDARHIDVLLSDAAGEHFSDHTRLADHAAQQSMAFLGRCDGFVVVADAAALLDDGGRKLDAELARMVRRVIEIVQARPGRHRAISLVFSKLDRVLHQAMPPERDQRRQAAAWSDLGMRSSRIFTALEDAGSAGIPWDVFPTTAFPGPLGSTQPIGVDAPFAFVLDHADRRERWPRRIQPIPADASSFDAMRRWPPPPGEQP